MSAAHPSQTKNPPRVACEVCGKSVAVYVGHNGYSFTRAHNQSKGEQCWRGSHLMVASIPKASK